MPQVREVSYFRSAVLYILYGAGTMHSAWFNGDFLIELLVIRLHHIKEEKLI